MNTKLAVIEGDGDVCRTTLRTQFSAHIDTVWSALTDIEQLKYWWPDWQPGGLIEPYEQGRVVLGDGSWIDGQVKIWAPPYVLAFSWREDDTGGEWYEPQTKSLLTIQLLQTAKNETALVLSQYAPRSSVVGGTAGWHYFAGERLKSLLENAHTTTDQSDFTNWLPYTRSIEMREKKLTEIHGSGPVRRLQTRNEIRAPIDVVWAALTQIEHVKQWWADGNIGTKVGEPFQLGGEEDLSGTIITLMKPHIFEFTWHDDPGKAANPEWLEEATSSLVHFDLVEIAADTTLLTLIQFAPLVGVIGASAGWHHIFEILTSYIETADATTTDDRFEELKRLYEY